MRTLFIMLACNAVGQMVNAAVLEHLTFDVDGTASVGFDASLGDAASIDTVDKFAGAGSLALSGNPAVDNAGSDVTY